MVTNVAAPHMDYIDRLNEYIQFHYLQNDSASLHGWMQQICSIIKAIDWRMGHFECG